MAYGAGWNGCVGIGCAGHTIGCMGGTGSCTGGAGGVTGVVEMQVVHHLPCLFILQSVQLKCLFLSQHYLYFFYFGSSCIYIYL